MNTFISFVKVYKLQSSKGKMWRVVTCRYICSYEVMTTIKVRDQSISRNSVCPALYNTVTPPHPGKQWFLPVSFDQVAYSDILLVFFSLSSSIHHNYFAIQLLCDTSTWILYRSFLLIAIGSISFHRHTPLCLPFHLLMEIGIAPQFWAITNKNVWTFPWTSAFFSLG